MAPSYDDCFQAGNAGNCNTFLCVAMREGRCENGCPLNMKGEPMKQEILCEDCSEEMKKIIGKGHKGEHTDFVPGRALRAFSCDFCGQPITPLHTCVAYSLWTDDRPMIKGWEKDFILTAED
jgi:hypothetical protein